MEGLLNEALPALAAGAVLLSVGLAFSLLSKIHGLLYHEIAEADQEGTTKAILRAIMVSQNRIEHLQQEMLETQREIVAALSVQDALMHKIDDDAEERS
jgi:hypothetical protein